MPACDDAYCAERAALSRVCLARTRARAAFAPLPAQLQLPTYPIAYPLPFLQEFFECETASTGSSRTSLVSCSSPQRGGAPPPALSDPDWVAAEGQACRSAVFLLSCLGARDARCAGVPWFGLWFCGPLLPQRGAQLLGSELKTRSLAPQPRPYIPAPQARRPRAATGCHHPRSASAASACGG